MRFALILSLLIAIIAVVFAFQNPDPVQVQFLTLRSIDVPLALVLLVTLLVGVLIGILGSLPNRFRSRGRIKRLEKRITELESGGGEPVVVEERVVDRGTPRPAAAPVSGGAAETQRLAAETQRMAAEAQRRAAEAERREEPPRRTP